MDMHISMSKTAIRTNGLALQRASGEGCCPGLRPHLLRFCYSLCTRSLHLTKRCYTDSDS